MALVGAGLQAFAVVAKNAVKAFAVGYQIADDITDVDHDSATGRYNIVLLIKAHSIEPSATATGFSAAIAIAVSIAKGHLENAISQSEQLPCNAGGWLQDLAQTLLQKLAAKVCNTKLH